MGGAAALLPVVAVAVGVALGVTRLVDAAEENFARKPAPAAPADDCRVTKAILDPGTGAPEFVRVPCAQPAVK